LRCLESGKPAASKSKTKGKKLSLIEKPTEDISKLSTLKIMVDGSSKGNPGPCGAGFVFQDIDGNTVLEGSKFLGNGTNNYAEYTALIYALETALKHKAKKVVVISDSQLMINQITGVYKIKNQALFVLNKQVQNLRRRFESIKFYSVRREANKRADELANIATEKEGE